MMSKKILFIPIDNRPVCYELPKLIALSDADNEIVMPEKSLLGGLTETANIKGIIEFVKRVKKPDIIVACLDTIAYGGLIPSRRGSESKEKILSRINKFVSLIKKTEAKVYVFSSIMRISNNNINEEEKEYWSEYGEKIFRYSYETDKYGKSELASIPSEILDDYINTRKRNFEINKYYIELQKQGIFDTLIFSKDDCAQFGFNVKEARELEEASNNEENIYIKTGADEIPLTLLSRALNKDKKIKIAPIYTNPSDIDRISKYEDVSVEKSINSQIETAGGIVSDINDCDLIFYINNFKTEQGELVMNVEAPLFEGEIKIPDKPYFIGDILNANGADNKFVKKLFEKEFLINFYGYAGWNTTGNAAGSAISVALTYFCAKKPDKKVFEKLQIIRFLDDYAYQANVRSEIRNNPENLTNGIIKEKMKPFENILIKKFDISKIKTSYSFPWNRFFEVGVSIEN